MNDSDTFDAAPDFGSEENLPEQFEGLRKLFTVSLAAMLILGISMTAFLLRQANALRTDLLTARPQLMQMSANFEKNEEPQIQSFQNALVGFARTHPDFKPILAKYNISVESAPTAAPKPAVPTNK